MVCLPLEEDRARVVVAGAAQLAEELRGHLSIVHVLPERRVDAERKEDHIALAQEFKAISWFLQTDTPETALRQRARLSRASHVILGPAALRMWGKDLSPAAEGAASLAELRALSPQN